MYGIHNKSPADEEVIDVLIAISHVSAKLARKLTVLAAQRQSEEGEKRYEQNERHCMQAGEYIRSTTDFYVALESAGGFDRRRTSKANMIIGLRLKSDFMK